VQEDVQEVSELGKVFKPELEQPLHAVDFNEPGILGSLGCQDLLDVLR
jgi:hypothetical protein